LDNGDEFSVVSRVTLDVGRKVKAIDLEEILNTVHIRSCTINKTETHQENVLGNGAFVGAQFGGEENRGSIEVDVRLQRGEHR
jgi:uncharacterized protein related to proFAR isomerase